MVSEISFEKYKAFCELLPSKDVFYLLKNLYVKFPNDENIYGVKYSTKQSANKIYTVLEKKQTLETMTLFEFLRGLPVNENNAIPNEAMYSGKSILIVLSESDFKVWA